MTHTRYAFVKANWRSNRVDQALKVFLKLIPTDHVYVSDVPILFDIPLIAKELAECSQCSAIAYATFVFDGGTYRHDL